MLTVLKIQFSSCVLFDENFRNFFKINESVGFFQRHIHLSEWKENLLKSNFIEVDETRIGIKKAYEKYRQMSYIPHNHQHGHSCKTTKLKKAINYLMRLERWK